MRSELLCPSIARRWIIRSRRCLQAVQLLPVQLSGDVAARPARLRRITQLRCVAGDRRVSWRRRRIVRIVGRRRIGVIRVLDIEARKGDADADGDAGVGRRWRNGPSADAESSGGESGYPETQRDFPDAIHGSSFELKSCGRASLRSKYASYQIAPTPAPLIGMTGSTELLAPDL